MSRLVTHSAEIEGLIRTGYRREDLDRLEAFLIERGVLKFRPLESGLYPAVQTGAMASGYQNVWVRDNVFVAYAHAANRRPEIAVAVVRALSKYFSKYLFRFDDIISGAVDRNDPMKRINVRLDGTTLEELPQKWSHAQNDALGYFVWLFCNLASERAFIVSGDELALMERFLDYFQAIRFWDDEDSGHWEERRKVEASSIGVVTGGLNALQTMLREVADLGERFGSARIEKDIRFAAELGEGGAKRSTQYCRRNAFSLTKAGGTMRRCCFSSTRSASSTMRWRTRSSTTSPAICKARSAFAVTSAIPIGAPTIASCFRRKSEAATSAIVSSDATDY